MSDSVDIDLVKRNAISQGVVLQEIAILYVGLDEFEKSVLRTLNLVKHESENTVIATFTAEGVALFSAKITGVHYLGAD